MAEPDFILKRNDTASSIRSTCENSGGTPVDVQGATVLWKMAKVAGGTLTTAGTATIDQVGDGSGTGGSMGIVHYNWTPANVATAGLYAGEWEVTFLGGTVQTFPNGDPILLLITPDL